MAERDLEAELREARATIRALEDKLARAAHFEWAYRELSARKGQAVTEALFWALHQYLNSCDRAMTAREVAERIEEVRRANQGAASVLEIARMLGKVST